MTAHALASDYLNAIERGDLGYLALTVNRQHLSLHLDD